MRMFSNGPGKKTITREVSEAAKRKVLSFGQIRKKNLTEINLTYENFTLDGKEERIPKDRVAILKDTLFVFNDETGKVLSLMLDIESGNILDPATNLKVGSLAN